MELFKANRQWAKRPADERFPNIQALYNATKEYASTAFTKSPAYNDLRTQANDGEVELVGRSNVPARLTHWAFGQLCSIVGAPASYLRDLPATLAAQNLSHGLKNVAREGLAQVLFHRNGEYVVRAITSDKYSRIWNYEVAERLLGLEAQGWEPAIPDLTWSDEQKGVTALYASDKDMFAFLRSKNHTVNEKGTDQPIYRGIIVENSEVGASALKLTRFLYRYMCGNHIIWGASEVIDLSLRHVGSVRERFSLYAAQIRKYAESSASDDEARIERAKHTVIAATKEEVLDAIFGIRSVGLSRKALEAGYDATVPSEDGSPNTAWGLAQGLTRYSQTKDYADERTAIDKAAGRLLDELVEF